MPSSELVRVTRSGHLATLTLQREDAMNARSLELRRQLIAAVDSAEAESEVRVIVLTGAGRAFSVGLDMAEAAARADLGIGEAHDARTEANDVARVAAGSKPTIAAINGYALGGGLELALACDIRIAAEDARLGLPEVTRGTLPGNGGTQRLPRLVGTASALELILTGEQISGTDAERIGLVNRAVPGDELLGRAQELASRIAANAPLALRFAKLAVLAARDATLEQGLALETELSVLMLHSEDRAEGIQAFREKRPPIWRGR